MDINLIIKDLKNKQEQMKQFKMKLQIDNKNHRFQEIKTMLNNNQISWDDIDTLKELSSLQTDLEQFNSLNDNIDDLLEIIDILEEETEYIDWYKTVVKIFDEYKISTLLSGKYDKNSAILSVYAGTGGLDAMDWAEKLQRMYTRWANLHNFNVEIIDIQKEGSIGIKSVTLNIKGEFAYGYLKNENGVHRVVRHSEFNAQGKRETSFAKVEVIPLININTDFQVDEKECRIDRYRASGAGGQHVNTTDSAIRITHIPTGLVVTCQNERSQTQNKEKALALLTSKLCQLMIEQQVDNINSLKGEYKENTWGMQIRSYVFQPYQLVKDHITNAEIKNINSVLDGDIDMFIYSHLNK